MRLPKISIRTNIFTHILILVMGVALVLSSIQYYFSKQLAYKATENTFHKTAEKIALDMLSRDKLAKEILYQQQNYPALTAPITGALQLDVVSRYIYTLLRYKNMYAIYIGKDNGNLLEVINMKSSKTLFEHFKAPQSTRWIAISVFGRTKEKIRRMFFLDESLSVIETREEKRSYRSSDRPWFTNAMGKQIAVSTEPYIFDSLQQPGITYSKRVKTSDTVLALDFTLARLHTLLKELKFSETSEITMFSSHGNIISSSSDEGVRAKVDKRLLEAARDKVFMMEVAGKSRFVMVTTMSRENGNNTYLSISVDRDEMLRPYLESIMYGLLGALILFIFSLPFIILSTSQIVKPINALMQENKKIIRRDFESVKSVKTNIIELIRLSDSFVEMSRSIHAYQEAQKELMDSFIRLIADAIDAKSPYTGGHCKRVPLIATMLVKEASALDKGSLRDFSFTTEEELDAFERGAWLHDCGKITTPEYVVDKATKLETIYNRIHEVRMRFEVLWRDIEIACLEKELKGEDKETLERYKENEHQRLIDDFHFIATTNLGGEFMSEERKHHVKTIAKRTWMRHFDDRLGLSENELMRYGDRPKTHLPIEERLLSDKDEHIVPRVDFDEEGYRAKGFKLAVPESLYNYGEVYNLCIERGTLSEEERFKIQEHVIMSIKMLEQLPFPEEMRRIPEYAGTHHETLDGTGYPRALQADELSVPSRVMAIADIFEALTASDRPYKKGKTLSEALKIMSFMVQDQHIDAELFALFLESGIYMEYAKAHLKSSQIDEVVIERYL